MIGRLKKVPVSEMYEAGGSNFTAWLQQNVDVLNEAVAGLSISGVEDEPSASPAELVARDASGGMVVIENEPEASGDGGLGRLITSLASIQARAGVWIVADSKPEHVAAVAWLNETSRADFYLLKVEAYRIDASPPAPFMTLISGPRNVDTELEAELSAKPEAPPASPKVEPVDVPVNGAGDPAGAAEPVAADGLVAKSEESAVEAEPASEGAVGVVTWEDEAPAASRDTTGLMLYQFWTELLQKAGERTPVHADIEPRRDTVISAETGVEGLEYNYVLREHDASVELFIDRGQGSVSENDTAFTALQATEDAIAYNFAGPLDWVRDGDSSAGHIEHQIDLGGYEDEDRWPEIQDAMIDAMIRLEKALRPHVQRLQL